MKRKISLQARKYIARVVRTQFVKRNRPMKQSVAIAYSKARRKGFHIPARR